MSKCAAVVRTGLTLVALLSWCAAPCLAAELDCRSGVCNGGGSTSFSFGGVTYAQFASALFTTADNGATANGVLDSFVRLQADQNVVQGMNSSRRPLNQGNEVSTTSLTHDLRGSSVPVVSIVGQTYYEFLLTANQLSNDPYLSLDGLQICTGSSANQYTGGTCDTNQTTLRYNLDSSNNNRIVFDANRNGSGPDLFVYIPTALFGLNNSTYVYLWSRFGDRHNNNGSFEEWAVRTTGIASPTSVPEPASLLLLGAGLLALGRRTLRQRGQPR